MTIRVVLRPDYARRVKIESSNHINRRVDTMKRILKRNLAPHVDTGALLKSVRSTKGEGVGLVWISTDHWQHLEYGTPPHIIRPRRKKALWWKGARHPVSIVHHPGARAYAPMRRAAAEMRILYRGR